jgi:hypothetical protein
MFYNFIVNYVDTCDLKNYEHKYQLFVRDRVNKIKSSINKYGMNMPILTQDDVVIFGHARLEALDELGWDSIPVINMDSISDCYVKSCVLSIVLQAVKEGWDENLLMLDLLDLCSDNECLASVSFSEPELYAIFNYSCCDIIYKAPSIEKDSYEIIVKCQEEYNQSYIHPQLSNQGSQCEMKL